jgi:radical SAM protein with 4Fe4S-binding SPASM domain
MTEPFFMQWHITDRCPLQCAHCYRGEPKAELPLDALRLILRRFREFAEPRGLPALISFAGGEPLLRRGELLGLIREATAAGIECRLLTNGVLLDAESAAELKRAGCSAVQVSIEGEREAHEALRGTGTFEPALRGARCAREAGMLATLSLTVSRRNLGEIDAAAALAREVGARLFVSRLVPCGQGAALREEVLTSAEWLNAMGRCRELRSAGLQVLCRDPLFAGFCTKRPKGRVLGGCAIGHQGLAVESDGDAYPCRRLPVAIGNLVKQDLDQVWAAPLLGTLRNRDALKGRCGACRLRWRCGGCRAVAFALAGDPLAEDPQCPWESA